MMIIRSLRMPCIFVFAFLLICSLLIESPFGKGGIDHYMHYVIFFATTIIAFIYILTIENLIFFEKITYSFLLSFSALSLSSIISGSILEKIYGYDYELFLSNIVANLIFYFLTNSFLICSILVMQKFKKLS